MGGYLAVPTADGAFVELPASVWVKPNRIVEPEEDGGATARLPTITSAASTSRAQVWGRKPQSAADSPVRKHRSAGYDSATALDSSATFSLPSSSYSYPSGSPKPSRSPPAKLPALTANGKRRGRPPKAKPAEEAHLAPSKKTQLSPPAPPTTQVVELSDNDSFSDDGVPYKSKRSLLRTYLE
ncbi:hypothetical protein DFS34DRAFT_691103 [Phlyctochytrium arcticum]|nr:hypothetical protein DFS34DRAFT_691103 [Phlyctochytrium arcticum]